MTSGLTSGVIDHRNMNNLPITNTAWPPLEECADVPYWATPEALTG